MDSSINTTNKISIRLQSDGFSLYISDSDLHIVSSKTVQAKIFELTTPALIELIKSQPEITSFGSMLSVTIENTLYNLIPEDVFSTENKVEMLNFQYNLASGDYSYEQNKIENTSIELVFALPKATKSAIQSVWGETAIIHRCTKLASSALLLHENGIFVQLQSGYIHILIVSEAKILLFNSYPVQTDTDILYHIVHVTNILQLSGLNKAVYLYSETPNPGLIELLKQHIDTVHAEIYQNH